MQTERPQKRQTPRAALRDESRLGANHVSVARLPATERTRLSALVASARLAAAVMEDDDAFYARLQALVRRALLGLGRRLCEADGPGRARPEDVFDLPLERFWMWSFELCAITVVDIRAGRPILRAHNLSGHLAPRLDVAAIAERAAREASGAL